MDYKEWTLEAIIDWCKANNQVAWLKATAEKQVEYTTYEKVESVSADGKKSWKLDKNKPTGTATRKISFVELKSEFIHTFIEKEAKSKKPSMYDLIAAL